MILTNYDRLIGRDAIDRVILNFGTEEVSLSSEDIGLFYIRKIDTVVTKVAAVSGKNMTAGEVFIEISNTCKGEIEYIVDICDNKNGTLLDVEVYTNDWANKDCYHVGQAWISHNSYRITARGDLRLFVGTDKNWPYNDVYESSPIAMFGGDSDAFDMHEVKMLEKGEVAGNHVQIVRKQQENLINTLIDLKRVFKFEWKTGTKIQRGKLILLASILDLLLIKEKGKKGLSIAYYTYYVVLYGLLTNGPREPISG